MNLKYTDQQRDMLAVFEKHVQAELDGDIETTMATMSSEPHLINVPNDMGGVGYEGVRSFYMNHLVGKFFPPDIQMERISLTIGSNQIVDELIVSFSHTHEIDWMLPKIAPTNKRVEVAFAVIVGFDDGKITHEHIYWDQATVLVQLGILDPSNLPVIGADGAKRIRQAPRRGKP
jgi:carboxymethylenebutenolidase